MNGFINESAGISKKVWDSIKIRKQGKCICDECGKSWTYDYEKEADMATFKMGHTDGFTHYIKCFEHKKIKN